jgi:hypothetical protein
LLLLTFLEVLLLSPRGILGVGQLLIAADGPMMNHVGACPSCGYCLLGTVSHRCSECGRTFAPADAGLESLGEANRLHTL